MVILELTLPCARHTSYMFLISSELLRPFCQTLL